MFDNCLIALRGTLGAGVLLCGLVAHVARTGRRDALIAGWAGAGAAGLSLAFGCALAFGSRELTVDGREALPGWLSIGAVALVTWVVFRMPRADAAAVAAAAFLSVGHEAVGTALFGWEAVRASRDGNHEPLAGVLVGLFLTAALCLLLRRGLRRVGARWFDTAIGVLLVVVAAGVLGRGVRHLQEARVVGGVRDEAFDVGGQIPPDSWYGALLDGTVGFEPGPTVTQTAVWALYPVAVLALFAVRSAGRPGVAGARRRAAARPR